MRDIFITRLQNTRHKALSAKRGLLNTLSSSVNKIRTKKAAYITAAGFVIIFVVIAGLLASQPASNNKTANVSSSTPGISSPGLLNQQASNNTPAPSAAPTSTNVNTSSSNSSSDVNVNVDGQSVKASKSGSVHKVISDSSGNTTVDIQIQNSNSSGSSYSSTVVNSNSQTSTQGGGM